MEKKWLIDYIENLKANKFATANFEDFIELKEPHIPDKLYRFRPLSEDIVNINGIGHIKADLEISNFQRSLIYLSPPEKFNDPYDSKPLFDPFNLNKKILADEELRNLYKINIEALIRKTDIKRHIYPEELEKIFRISRDQFAMLLPTITSVLRISCLSENDYSNMLMWSHYGSQHSGYCIEYELSELDKNNLYRRCLFPVVYSEKIFDLSEHFLETFKKSLNQEIKKEYLTNASLLIFICVLYKAKCWEYEKEWRIIAHGGTEGLINNNFFPTPKPQNIYLGTKIDDFRKEQLKKLADGMGIGVYEIFLKGDEYSLIAKKI